MGKWKCLCLFVLAAMLLALAPTVLAAPPDPGIPDAGPVPPGLALKVFVHYPKGHGPGLELANPSICNDPSPSGCGDCSIATTSGNRVRWSTPGAIPYHVMANFNAKKSPKLTAANAIAAIDASFVTWEQASDAGLNFIYRGAPSGKVSIPKADGKNVVGWKAIQGNAIAVTYIWYNPYTGYIAEFDMAFNDRLAWSYTLPVIPSGDYADPTNPGLAGTFDVRDIGTHEAGHTLMLLDLYDPSQANLTMYGYGTTAELKKDTLALGDANGVKEIY